jgi:uncharacterized membrane protein
VPQAEHAVTIARPVEKVFAFVADGERGTTWRSGVLEIRHVSGEGVGSRYRQVVAGPMNRRVDADYEITAFEPNRLIEFQTVAGPVRPRGRYVFEPAGDSTRLTFSLDAQLSGIRGLLLGSAVARTMTAEVRALDRLKTVLEGG